jgi:hypothetical protein
MHDISAAGSQGKSIAPQRRSGEAGWKGARWPGCSAAGRTRVIGTTRRAGASLERLRGAQKTREASVQACPGHDHWGGW